MTSNQANGQPIPAQFTANTGARHESTTGTFTVITQGADISSVLLYPNWRATEGMQLRKVENNGKAVNVASENAKSMRIVPKPGKCGTPSK